MAEPTAHELAQHIAVLEERMNTSYERLNASYERLRADMAKRDSWLLLAIVVVVAAATTILGVLIAANS